jgi:oxygen-dependent protoporphyrinogen oxidase
MAASELGAVVIGAGAAGLGAAHALATRGVELALVDAGDRPGGVMRSERIGGFLVERGPNTAMIKAPALELLRRLGLEAALVSARPESRRRCIFHAGRLEPLPAGPLAAARTPLLSARGKLRVLAEPFVRRGDPTGESVAEFATRRLGAEAAERLVGTFLVGVYAGDERRLGAEAVFPSLVALEREHGSLVRGALAGLRGPRSSPRGLSGIFSTADGLGGLAESLARGVGGELALRTRALGLARDGAGWRVAVSGSSGERELRARAVVLALPADAAGALLAPADAEAAAVLAGMEYAPVVSVSVGVSPADVREPIEGFGFLVPRTAGLRLLGCLFMSRIFPARAPAGRELLTCMLGGVRWPEAVDAPDDALLAALRADLDRALGLRGEPQPLAVSRWPRAVPQPGRDHPRRVAALRARIAGLPGLALAGAYLEGVAVADALASGLRAGDSIAAASASTQTG